MQDALDDQNAFPAVAIFSHLLPGECAAQFAPRKGDDLGERRSVGGIGTNIGKARDSVAQQRQHPAGRLRDLHEDAGAKIKSAGNAGGCFARARGAHRHIERQHQRAAAGGFGAPYQIETDGVIVLGKPIKLEPEHVRRNLGDAFDGGAADCAQYVGNARALRGAGEMQVGTGPHDRRAAHRRHAERRGIAAAKEFHIARRRRRYEAVARHQLDRIERCPIAL